VRMTECSATASWSLQCSTHGHVCISGWVWGV